MKTCTKCNKEKDITAFRSFKEGNNYRTHSWCKECESSGKYQKQKNKNPDRYLEQQRIRVANYKKKYPEKISAKQAVQRALKSGKLVKSSKCEICGGEAAIQAHHHSYEKQYWLDVKWVCQQCHNNIHKGERSDPLLLNEQRECI